MADQPTTIGARRQLGEAWTSASLPARADVAVVGAGIIGLSIAWRLAQTGRSVTVLERARIGAGASLAATGMLAPAAEHEPGSDPLLPLALDSLARWPGFRDDLQAASGLDIDYRTHGTLVLAIGRDEVERLRFRHSLQTRSGIRTRWLSGPDAREREPMLRPSVSAGILCEDDHQVDPRRVMAALTRACRRAGVTLVAPCTVEALDWAAGRVRGVRTPEGHVQAETVILASGAWSGAEGLLPAELALPVRPIKGQALAVKTTPRTGTLTHMVWTEQVHMAPKGDGDLIVGATVEDCGFRSGLTAGGLYAVLEGARRVLPGIEEMEVTAMWSGYRPTSDDDAPIVDELAPGLVVATGHHRNGYLLTPATADAVTALIATGELPAFARNFGVARFRLPVREPERQSA
ncbi:MAG: glycine oxidase ThiO [Methylobacterium sp.]|uniref:glycine oxidase ThiO n=1 Tax=Methylobacterium sp. TaxID=409 RepID=UPI0025D1C666|nr:glycine oxidase ThiO [Methylobacterium sp.]MBX9932543.1 glycine oxidase ThiO [Methylobacterium sp.]